MKTDLDLVKERLEYLPEEDPYRVFKWKFSYNQKKQSSFNARCAGNWGRIVTGKQIGRAHV